MNLLQKRQVTSQNWYRPRLLKVGSVSLAVFVSHQIFACFKGVVSGSTTVLYIEHGSVMKETLVNIFGPKVPFLYTWTDKINLWPYTFSTNSWNSGIYTHDCLHMIAYTWLLTHGCLHMVAYTWLYTWLLTHGCLAIRSESGMI